MRYRLPGSLLLLAALAPAASADGDRVALCVGVNKYDHAGFDNLDYAENDATQFAAVLRDAGYRVVLMTTAAGKLDPKLAPTRANVRTQVEALLEPRKRGDLVVVAFSGHGSEFDKDPDTYFCPADAKPQADRKDTLVSLGWVYDQLGRSGAGTKLLLADCCRNDPDPTKGRGPDDTLEKVPPKGVMALYACAPNQRAYEHHDLKHGVFFHHVLEGLRGKAGAADEDLQFERLVLHVRTEVLKTVARLTKDRNKQTPTLKAPTLAGDPVVMLTKSDQQLLADGRAVDKCIRTTGQNPVGGLP